MKPIFSMLIVILISSSAFAERTAEENLRACETVRAEARATLNAAQNGKEITLAISNALLRVQGEIAAGNGNACMGQMTYLFSEAKASREKAAKDTSRVLDYLNFVKLQVR